MKIREMTVHEARCRLSKLPFEAEYAEESSFLGKENPRWDVFYGLEAQGFLYAWGAFGDNDDFLGFISLLIYEHTHTNARIGEVEAFFVSKKYRKASAGLTLLYTAQKKAKVLKCKYFLVSAPIGGALSKVLDRMKNFKAFQTIYRKELGDGTSGEGAPEVRGVQQGDGVSPAC